MKIRVMCCGQMVDKNQAILAENAWGEFWVCSEEHKGLVEMATRVQMDRMAKLDQQMRMAELQSQLNLVTN